MGNKEYTVIEILDVLRRHRAGDGIRTIVKATHIARNTVRKYIRLAQETGLNEADADLEDIAYAVFREVHNNDNTDDANTRDSILLDKWCLTAAGMRIHGTTRQKPRIVFEEQEKSLLLPLREERFDVPKWSQNKAHPDHHIRCGNALYSIPTEYIGKAKEIGTHCGGYMEELLSGDFPWTKLRQAQKLIRLSEKYGTQRIEQACSRALSFSLIDAYRLERIIKQAFDKEAKGGEKERGVVVPGRFGRPAEYFKQNKEEQKALWE